MRKLSRKLLDLWTSDGKSGPAFQLLSRCLPSGLIQYLFSQEQAPAFDVHEDSMTIKERDNLELLDEANQTSNGIIKSIEEELNKFLSHWRSIAPFRFKSNEQTTSDVVILRRRRAKTRKDLFNWPLFYYQFYKDHQQPDLIWDFHTRQELKQCLQTEYDRFVSELENNNNPIYWNHYEFNVTYKSLQSELQVGQYYLRLLIALDDSTSDNLNTTAFIEPTRFFSQLYHRFLLTPSRTKMRYACLRALSFVYRCSWAEIGQFLDTQFILGLLRQNICGDKRERDLLLEFIDSLSCSKVNCFDMIESVQILIDACVLAHLHVDRPKLVGVATGMIEEGNYQHTDAQWFYLESNGSKCGPFSFDQMIEEYKENKINRRTQIWASGLYAWRPIDRVSQFYWKYIEKEVELESIDSENDNDIECDIPWIIKNESDLCLLALKVLKRLCDHFPCKDTNGIRLRPLPKIISRLSSPSNLATIVQLFLTFDPAITEHVASLLCVLLQDNPIASVLFETGCFFFVLMYQGSNLLPIAQLLYQTHRIQATSRLNINDNSVLSPMLPSALIFYLDNYGPEKFAQLFVSECKTPEAIWNTALRRHLVQCIALHLSDYTSKLKGNIYLPFKYCPIPLLEYPDPLKNQLFCNRFYLNELLNHKAWPIPDALQLLKDCIHRWREEMEAKPSDITLDSACLTLELIDVDLTDPKTISELPKQVRQAYFRLAQKTHPDKNPGIDRGLFEQVSKSYELLMDFLTNDRSSEALAKRHEINVVTLMMTQVHVYKRFKNELSPYRYPGYDLLVDILQQYTDEQGNCDLFSLSLSNNDLRSILPVAIELCVETIDCSRLNAEAFRAYPNSIQLLSNYYTRCSAIVSSNSKDLSHQVCLNIARFWQVAGQFSTCRALVPNNLHKELCHVLRISQNKTSMSCLIMNTMAACASLAVHNDMKYIHDCTLWNEIVQSLFRYDVTFQPFEDDDMSSDQLFINRTAEYASTILFSQMFSEHFKVHLPFISIFNKDQGDVKGFLKAFHSNIRSPLIIWNESCRNQLLQSIDGDFDGYDVLSDEITINGVYIKPFLEQPEALENPSNLLFPHVFNWIKDQTEKTLALEVIEVLCSKSQLDINDEHVNLLNSMLLDDVTSERTCKILINMCKYEDNINIISNNDDITSSLLELAVDKINNVDASCIKLQILNALIGIDNVHLVRRLVSLRVHLHLTYLMCSSDVNSKLRVASANLLNKIIADPLSGPQCRIELRKYIPNAILDQLNDSQLILHMIDGEHDNPEFKWSERVRLKVCNQLNKKRNASDDSEIDNDEEEEQIALYDSDDGVTVCGVRLSALLNTPGYQVRFPSKLSNALLEQFTVDVHTLKLDNLDLYAESLLVVWQDNKQLLDLLPSTGYIQIFCSNLLASQLEIRKAVMKMICGTSSNFNCQTAYANNADLMIAGIGSIIREHLDLRIDALNTLNELVQGERAVVFATKIQEDIADMLLEMLCSETEVDHQINARIVKLIKQLKELNEMDELLNRYPRWAHEYQPQSHELFLEKTPIDTDRRKARIKAGQTFAGYLMDRPTDGDAPPPIDQVDFS